MLLHPCRWDPVFPFFGLSGVVSAPGRGGPGPVPILDPFWVHFWACRVGEQLPRAELSAGYATPYQKIFYMHTHQISYHTYILFFSARCSSAPTYTVADTVNPPYFGDYLGTIWGLFWGLFGGLKLPPPPQPPQPRPTRYNQSGSYLTPSGTSPPPLDQG